MDCSWVDFCASWQAEVASSAAAAISSAPFRYSFAPESASDAFFRISAQFAWISSKSARDLEQILGDDLGLFHFLAALLAGRFRVSGDHLHLVLNLVDHFLNAARTLLADFREIADFVGNHGESLAVFPGAGGFDGGVQGQQVGLVGDPGHGMHDLTDLFGLALQFADHLGGFDISVRGVPDPFDESLDVGRG